MAATLSLLVWNVLLATLLVAGVWLACRFTALRRRPALCHALWLLVLVKLITPTLIPLPILPASAPSQSIDQSATPSLAMLDAPRANDAQPLSDRQREIEIPSTSSQAAASPQPTLSENLQTQPPRPAQSLLVRFMDPQALPPTTLLLAVAAISGTVTLILWLAAMRQLRKVGHLLRGQESASGRVGELLQDVAREFQLAKVPRPVLVDAAIAPMLWGVLRKPAILLPTALVERLDDPQLRGVLAHELAHFARRDHWTSLFAFIVTTLCWWNPLAWLARRELAAAAEACCDALTLERSAISRRTYAQVLLSVTDFLNLSTPLQPSWSVAFGGSQLLKKRVELLATTAVRSRLPRASWLLLAIAFAATMFIPTQAQFAPAAVADATEQPEPASKPPRKSKDGNNSPAGAPAVESPESAGHYFVTGRVFDEASGQPIEGATLNFLFENEQDREKRGRKAITDKEGRYRLEVPLGSFQLWFPWLRPGYWLEPEQGRAMLTTSVEQPTVTHDIAARRAPVWPVQLILDGGGVEDLHLLGSVQQVEDDTLRRKLLANENVSFAKLEPSAFSSLDENGHGALTQCGDAGKLVVRVGGEKFKGVMAEFVIEPGFDNTKIKSIEPVADTDQVTMIDEAGKTATISKAKVTIEAGLPLFTFRLERLPPALKQKISGRIVDTDGEGVAEVRVGAGAGTKDGGSSDTGVFVLTDQNGRFLIDVPLFEANEQLRAWLIVTKDGFASFDTPFIDVSARNSDTIDAGQFTLQRGGSAAIRTVDQDGKPLAGVVVEPNGHYAWRRQAIRTDKDGRGILRNLPTEVVRVQARYGNLSRQEEIIVSLKPAADDVTTIVLKASTTTPTTTTNESTPVPAPPPIGTAAPELSLVGWTDGKEHSLREFRGRVVVLDFWGVWCSACLNDLPVLKQTQAKYSDNDKVVFLGIHSAGTDMQQVTRLQRMKEWTLLTGLDRGNEIIAGDTARAYGVRGWPTTVIIDREGKIAYNSNLEHWTQESIKEEFDRIATALKLPPEDPNATEEAQMKRYTACKIYRTSELIERALNGQK